MQLNASDGITIQLYQPALTNALYFVHFCGGTGLNNLLKERNFL
jgi:hypothetical protein